MILKGKMSFFNNKLTDSGFMLEKDLPIDSGKWLISGPEHLVPDYVSFSSLISENSIITDKDSEQGWLSFSNFEKAKSNFRN